MNKWSTESTDSFTVNVIDPPPLDTCQKHDSMKPIELCQCWSMCHFTLAVWGVFVMFLWFSWDFLLCHVLLSRFYLCLLSILFLRTPLFHQLIIPVYLRLFLSLVSVTLPVYLFCPQISPVSPPSHVSSVFLLCSLWLQVCISLYLFFLGLSFACLLLFPFWILDFGNWNLDISLSVKLTFSYFTFLQQGPFLINS